MADPRDLARLPEPELELALRELGRALAWPATATTGSTGDDPAARARRRIVSDGIRPDARRWSAGWPGRRPIGSSVGLALVGLLAIAAIAAAIGLGLPGIRILTTSSPVPTASPTPTPRISVPGSAVPSPSLGPLGWRLGLGEPLSVDGVRTAVGFPVRLLPDALGAPASAWLLDGRLSVVWPAGGDLPPLAEADLGLVLTEMEGDVDPGYFQKIVGPGTRIESVRVDGTTGYWISGRPHELVYVNPLGDPVFDRRRTAGDTLLWARDGITYRLETALGREAAIALADALR